MNKAFGQTKDTQTFLKKFNATRTKDTIVKVVEY